jgi:hypothetical protein
MKKIHFHSGGVIKMDSTKVFGKGLDFQEIIRKMHRGDSQ